MFNVTAEHDLPPLPSYTLTPLPSLLPSIPDSVTSMLINVFAYWLVSGIFHFIDIYDFFPQYRLHTPAEILARNHATRWEVFRDVVLQQVLQGFVGYLLGLTEPIEMTGKGSYDIAVWARRIRIAQRSIPTLMGFVGLDAVGMARNMASSHPDVAGFLSGGNYANLNNVVMDLSNDTEAVVPAFARWELLVSIAIYHVGIPFIQFSLAAVFLDTWQYALHRGMHMNRFLYNTLHSRHHRLYVPYAYGALYNHPIEGFLLDIVGSCAAFKLTGLTARQGMWFFTISAIKTVDDHCGYAFPWDPLQHISGNNAAYHDIHHQSWGIKTNFSQPFFTFWDGLLGTMWKGGDVSARYERSRIAAQKKIDKAGNVRHVTTPSSIDVNHASAQVSASQQQVLEDPAGGATIMMEEAEEELGARKLVTKSMKRRTGSDGLKGLRDRVTPSAHGRTSAILGMDVAR